MKPSRMWLTLAAAVWFAASGTAAPVPVPPPASRGPITDALRLRGLLPTTAPLRVTPAVLAGEGAIEMDRQKMVAVTKRVAETIRLADGKTATVERTVTEMAAVSEKMVVRADACKFFTVSKEGKLESIDAAKAMALLKKKTAVLTGESAEVDTRTLELVKPGTLCVIPLPPSPTAPPPLIPPGIPRN